MSEIIEIMRLNLLSPMVLAFLLGIIAVRVQSNLRIPDQVYDVISIYLLFSIGLNGGFDLAAASLDNFGLAALAAIILGAVIPITTFFILRRLGRMTAEDALAIGIHFGAVSAVTLSAAITFLQEANEPFEGFMPTMYVIMELPAVIVGLVIAQRIIGGTTQTIGDMFKAALTGKSFLLLGGGVIIGFLSGQPGQEAVEPFFLDLFAGFLTLFLLEMGTLVGRRLDDIRQAGTFLVASSIILPTIHGFVGVAFGAAVGLSVGGSMIMGTLAASGSFITAPALVQNNLPNANPGFYLTSALVITFPFNLTFGLPLFYEFARLLV